jgi:hypothetical protein
VGEDSLQRLDDAAHPLLLGQGNDWRIKWHREESRNRAEPLPDKAMVIPEHVRDVRIPKTYRPIPTSTKAVTVGRAALRAPPQTSARRRKSVRHFSR